MEGRKEMHLTFYTVFLGNDAAVRMKLLFLAAQ
jgi:hypothetical protein